MDRSALEVSVIGIAAAAALASPEEATLHDELTQAEAPPAVISAADLYAAIWGQRANESAYHAARSAGVPKGIPTIALFGPLMVVAAARMGIEDASLEERVTDAVERTGHARGRALLAQAKALRAARKGEYAKAEKLLLDAVQSFATLRLDHERAIALRDRASVLARNDRIAEAASSLEEARTIADKIDAAALRATLEVEDVRAL
jgi:hypothetical protein